MRLQLTCKAGVRKNREHGSTMLMFTFHLGPLEVFCLAHLPREGETESEVYVKVALKGRTLVDAGTSEVENWVSSKGEPCADAEVRLEGADEDEQIALGPLLVVAEGGGPVLKLRKRSLIDPKYKSFEEWRVVK
jgi:hypothetical protein